MTGRDEKKKRRKGCEMRMEEEDGDREKGWDW